MDLILCGKSEPQRVLIEHGDVLFVRNTIPHRGCGKLSDYTNHRIHISIEPANLQDTSATKSVPLNDFGSYPKWCDLSQIFISSFE